MISRERKRLELRKDLVVTFLLITIVPFCAFAHFQPLGDFWPFFIACTTVVFCSVICLGIANYKQNAIAISPFVVCLTAFFIVLCLLTLIQQVSTSDRLILFVYSLVSVLAALLAVQLAFKKEVQYYDYLAFILVLGGIIEGVSAIAIQYRLWGVDYWMVPILGRFIGFIAQSNQLAIYMVSAFLALCYLSFRKLLPSIIVFVICAFFGFILLGSGSRAIILYLIAVIGITLFCLWRSKNKAYLKLLICLAALLIGALIYYYLPVLMKEVSGSVEVVNAADNFTRSQSSDSFRLSEMKKALHLFQSSPLIGIGYGNYAAEGVWLSALNPQYIALGQLTLHSHNLFTQIMAEFGMVGLIALLALLAYTAIHLWRAPKTFQWWLVVGVLSVYFINSMLENVLWRLHFVPLLMLIVAPVLSNTSTWRFPRFISLILWLVLAVVAVIMANNALTTYAKSFFYTPGLNTVDQTDYAIFKSATKDPFWGREIQLSEFQALSPYVEDFNYQQEITDKMLAWQPYAAVIASKMQLLLMSGRVEDLAFLSKALVANYPNDVPSICGYFKDFSTHNLQGMRVINKELNCRKYTSSHQ